MSFAKFALGLKLSLRTKEAKTPSSRNDAALSQTLAIDSPGRLCSSFGFFMSDPPTSVFGCEYLERGRVDLRVLPKNAPGGRKSSSLKTAVVSLVRYLRRGPLVRGKVIPGRLMAGVRVAATRRIASCHDVVRDVAVCQVAGNKGLGECWSLHLPLSRWASYGCGLEASMSGWSYSLVESSAGDHVGCGREVDEPGSPQ